VQLDIGRALDLLLRHRHLQVIRTEREAGQRHESQVAADQALLDGAEHWLVGLDVDVHVLELADLLPIAVDQRLAVPLGDVRVMSHCFLPPCGGRCDTRPA
jgi:hypothetical protein